MKRISAVGLRHGRGERRALRLSRSTYLFLGLFLAVAGPPSCGGGRSKKSNQAGQEIVVAVPLTSEQAAMIHGLGEVSAVAQVEGITVEQAQAGGIVSGIRGGVRGGVRAGAAGGVRGGIRAVTGRRSLQAASSEAGVKLDESRRVVHDPTGSSTRWGSSTSHRPAATKEVSRRQSAEAVPALAYELGLSLPPETAKGDHVLMVTLSPTGAADIPLLQVGAPMAFAPDGKVQDKEIGGSDVSMPSSNKTGLPNLVQAFAKARMPELGLDPASSRPPLTDDEIAKILNALQKPLDESAKSLVVQINITQNINITTITVNASTLAVPNITGLTCLVPGESCSPGATIHSPRVVFSFGCDRVGGCTFKCSLDKAPFAACEVPHVISELSEGIHTLAVKAIDLKGVEGPELSLMLFVLLANVANGGTTGLGNGGTGGIAQGAGKAPVVTFSETPPAVGGATASFTIVCAPECAFLSCSLDGAAFSSCSSPVALSSLKDGAHTFRVKGASSEGLVSEPITHTWASVAAAAAPSETTPPDTTLSAESGQSSVASGQFLNKTEIKFTFSCNDPGLVTSYPCTFFCQLDVGIPSSCVSPLTLSLVTDGSHTFSVYAVDKAGNKDATPATFAWTIDTVAPVVAISSQPPAVSNQTSVSFTFSSNDTGAALTCKFDQPLASGAFASCASPQAQSLSKGDGSYSFTVQATDAAGNAGSASFTWTLDTAAPSVAFSSQPSAISGSSSASFVFSSTDATATFECALDTAAYATCTSPVALGGLAEGSRTYTVRARDSAGNLGSASHTWTVDLTPPTFGGATGATALAANLIQVTWAAPSDTVSPSSSISFEICQSTTSGGCVPFTYAAMGNPGTVSKPFSGLAAGTRYYYIVRAKDEAGNYDTNTTEKSARTWSTNLVQTASAHLGYHSCALASDGTAKCWGYGFYGQLGDGATQNRSTPVTVAGLTGAITVAAGYYHTCALLSGGTVKCWGLNDSGRLGDGTSINKPTPVTVSTLSGAVALGGGSAHSCALLSSGTLRCWGSNSKGQLGDGSTASKSTPVASGGAGGVVALAGGEQHMCSVLAGGTVECWGYGLNGQLGDGTTIDRITATTVSSLSDAVAIAAGRNHTCALLSGGTVRCWGYNLDGELGDGTSVDRWTPVAASSLTSGTAVSAGYQHTCALLVDGSVKCWGLNDVGQLGVGSLADQWVPMAVSTLTGSAALAAGYKHTCSLFPDGRPKCWGYNFYGQLGDGTTMDKSTPVAVSMPAGPMGAKLPRLHEATAGRGGPARPFREGLAAHLGNHTCALVSDGTSRCWGRNNYGQLGDGTTAPVGIATPVVVSGLSNAVAMTTGDVHTCSLLADGTVRCWGFGGNGRLGDGTATSKWTPVAVSSLSGVVAVAGGDSHTCSLLSDGTAKCWGYGVYGQLGDGTTASKTTPVVVTTLTGAVALTTGNFHNCVLLSNGTVNCWGRNDSGQLGEGSTTNTSTPVAVSTLSDVAAVAAGETHTCSLMVDGTVKCWGMNGNGQIGDGSISTRKTPIVVSTLTGAVAVTGGASHTCSLLADGTAKCWGNNNVGQLGDGTSGTDRKTPVAVTSLSGAAALAAAEFHTCSLFADGTVKCWGSNLFGQLGDGTTVNRQTPAPPVNLP